MINPKFKSVLSSPRSSQLRIDRDVLPVIRRIKFFFAPNCLPGSNVDQIQVNSGSKHANNFPSGDNAVCKQPFITTISFTSV